VRPIFTIFEKRRDFAASVVEARQHARSDRHHGGHVHGRREHVVGRLAAIHVVIGMDQAPVAARTAEQFARAVGQHLIHVHVGLRT